MTKTPRPSPRKSFNRRIGGLTGALVAAAALGQASCALAGDSTAAKDKKTVIEKKAESRKALEGRRAFTDSTQSHQFTGGIDVIITF